ncbi:MAG: fibrobacter succinogenes major paralogous domain-containing protein [Rikenellaceae bacterium]|nr:fibrobacter succinogenes major paralogous domain-containing protein [Rikenellaceae bacterium]
MEFPAVGYRGADSSGTLYSAGQYGNYWSSVADGSNYAYTLDFSSGNVSVDWTNLQNGRSVRCVR